MFSKVRLVPAGPHKRRNRPLVALLVAVGLLLLGGAAVVILTQPPGPSPSRATVSIGGAELVTLSYAQTVPISETTRGLNVFPANGTKAEDGALGFMSYSPRVVKLLSQANVKVLRFPGGDWGDEHTLSYEQVDRFLKLCEETGAKPAISVRLRGGSVEEALRLLDYVNNPDNINHKQRGTPDIPVNLWMIGNEPSGYEQWGNHKTYTAKDYSRDFIRYAAALKGADPSILIMGDEQHQYSLEDPVKDSDGNPWMSTFLQAVADEEKRTGTRLLDIVSFHRYPLYNTMDEQTLFNDAGEWNSLISGLRADILNAFGEQRPIAITEINGVAVYSAPADFGEEVMANALWWADTYGALASSGIDYLFFFAAQGLDPPLVLINRGEEPTPAYQVYAQTSLMKGGMATQSYWSDRLSIYIARDAEAKLTTLMFVNKSHNTLSDVNVRLPGITNGKNEPGSFNLEPLSVTIVSIEADKPMQMTTYGFEQAQRKAGVQQTTVPAGTDIEEASQSKP